MGKFQVKKATRERIYVKIALMAPSGGGKTYGSLRLATGMAEEIKRDTGKDAKILMINTEQKRGYYYANEFAYDIIDIEPPHTPETYIEAIRFAEDEGYDILILDSSSHEWEGKGGCLDLHRQAGGQYQHWAKVTPRHDAFINALSSSRLHVIATMRGKDQYVMTQEGNKSKVEKVGVGAKQREGFEYEFTCTFLIDQKTSTSEAQKDNTHIFENEGAVLLSEDHGRRIIKWANTSKLEPAKTPKAVEATQDIADTTDDTDELTSLIKQIDALAKEKAKINKSAIAPAIKSAHTSANYNNIKDVEVAKKVLEALSKVQKPA